MLQTTDPNDSRPYEKQREDFLPAAELLFTAAHLRGIFTDWRKQNIGRQADMESLFEAAQAVSGMYEELYGSPDRLYHTLQHPRVQLLNEDELKMLEALHQADKPPTDQSYRTTVTKLAFDMTEEEAERLRNLDRHDCLYCFDVSESEQHQWLAPLRGKRATVENILKGKVDTQPLRFDEPMIPGVSVGMLMAVLAFPGEQGGYDKKKNFTDALFGLNEWASAVYAVQEENAIRAERGLPSLTTKEKLGICVTLAATYPFQSKDHLDQMAEHLYVFMKAPRRKALRVALGVSDDGELRQLVDSVVSTAGHFANQDVQNFGAADVPAFYAANRTAIAEIVHVDASGSDPVQEFILSYLTLNAHANEPLRKALNPQADGKDGFIRTAGNGDHIYHSFGATLSGNNEYQIPLLNKGHQQYQDNAEAAIKLHQRDMTFAALEMLGKPVVKDKKNLSQALVDAFFAGEPSAAATLVALTQKVAHSMEEFRDPSKQEDVNALLETREVKAFVRQARQLQEQGQTAQRSR